MFEQLMGQLGRGLSLIEQGRAVVDEATENIAAARETLATDELAQLDTMLDRVTEESQALSSRIQAV